MLFQSHYHILYNESIRCKVTVYGSGMRTDCAFCKNMMQECKNPMHSQAMRQTLTLTK